MSTKKAPIYTTGPLPLNRETSQLFKTYGAAGSPTSIGELRITMVQTFKIGSTLATFLTTLYAAVAWVIHRKEVKDFPSRLPPTKVAYDLSPRPGLVITINPKSPESKITALETAGFSARTNGRYKYYVGPGTDACLQAAIRQGVVTDAFAPGNNTSINGIITFSIMSRILHHAFLILAQLEGKIKELRQDLAGLDTEIGEDFKILSEDDENLPPRGFFFPYFDGLLLPDHGVTITTFIRLFSPILAEKPRDLAEVVKTLMSGWGTLNNTPAGREYSHMLFCIGLAISCGVKIRPVFLTSAYAGVVFYSDTSFVTIGTVVYAAQDLDGLKEGIKALKSHESALSQICDIINDIPADDDTKSIVTPSNIICARDLHNAFRLRTLAPDTIQLINPLLRKVRFEQSLWDVTNPLHVRKAIHYITSKEFPPSEVPMNLRLDCVFSKKKIYSVLGAFGNKAPSVRGFGSQITRQLSPTAWQDISKPGRLTGIPIFAKAHNEAKEDWESVMKDCTFFFDTKGADKEGKLRVKRVSCSIPFDSEDGKAIKTALGRMIRKEKRKVREEEDDEPGQSREEIERESGRKKRRIAGLASLGLSFPIPQEEGMDVSDGEDFLA